MGKTKLTVDEGRRQAASGERASARRSGSTAMAKRDCETKKGEKGKTETAGKKGRNRRKAPRNDAGGSGKRREGERGGRGTRARAKFRSSDNTSL